jgi:hypothetical protein
VRISRIFTGRGLSAVRRRVIKHDTLFQISDHFLTPCPPSFIFTFFGISDRWRIERGDSAPEIPEKTASESGGFFSPSRFPCFHRFLLSTFLA